MKVDVKKIDAIKRELRFEVPKERVSQKLDEAYKDLGKVAKIKGFRKGKVPRHILEKQHKHIAQEEALKKLVPEVYQEGLKETNITPIEMPKIVNVDLKEGMLTFTALLDIKPDVHVKNYKGIKVKRKSSEVTDDEINKTFEYIKQGQGKEENVTIDDAFAHGLGYPNLEEFKKTLRRQMEMDKDRQNRADVENQIVEVLAKNSKFEIPQSLVARQLEHRLAEMKERLKKQGIKVEDLNKKEEDMRKELKTAVEKDVQVYLILDKIAEVENITVPQGENLPAKVMEFLLKEAKWEEK